MDLQLTAQYTAEVLVRHKFNGLTTFLLKLIVSQSIKPAHQRAKIVKIVNSYVIFFHF